MTIAIMDGFEAYSSPKPKLYRLGTPDNGVSIVGGNERLYDYRGVLERVYDCPGHIASDINPRICRYCGTHSKGA